MVSKEEKKVQEEAKGVEGIGLSSGEERGRESVVAEASCPGDWRVARIWGREAPAHSSAAMCHQPCGHSATGEPVRSRLLPAPQHWQARRLPRGGRPASIRRSCSFSAPWPRPCRSLQQPRRSGRTGTLGWLQSRHHRASTPPQLGWQQLALTKGFRFSRQRLRGCGEGGGHQPLVLTAAEAEAGGVACCRLQGTTMPLAAQPCCNAAPPFSLSLLTLPTPPPPLATKDQTGSPCISNH